LREGATEVVYTGTEVSFGNENQLMVIQNAVYSHYLKMEATYGFTTYQTNAFTTSMACPELIINTIANSTNEVPETVTLTKKVIY
jgi:hypothetical protein